MDFNLIQELITNLGFPIACCGCLAWYIGKRDKQQTEDRQAEREALLDEIKFNREVNSQLLATNKLLASDIKVELQDIKSEIKHINDKE